MNLRLVHNLLQAANNQPDGFFKVRGIKRVTDSGRSFLRAFPNQPPLPAPKKSRYAKAARKTEAAATLRSPPLFSVNPICLLILHRVAHFLAGGAHVFASLFHRVEFRLLRRGQDRPNLGHGVLADRLDLLLRFLTGRLNLRLRLIEDRLNLRYLIRGQIERLG